MRTKPGEQLGLIHASAELTDPLPPLWWGRIRVRGNPPGG